MSDYALYILMRYDLKSMGPGRAAAQASHAANAFIHKYGKRKDVQKWQKQTKQGFGTAIILSVDSDTLYNVINTATSGFKAPSNYVMDPEYVIRVTHEVAQLLSQNYDAAHCNYKFDYDTADADTVSIVRSENTCGYVFGDREKLKDLLGTLSLYT